MYGTFTSVFTRSFWRVIPKISVIPGHFDRHYEVPGPNRELKILMKIVSVSKGLQFSQVSNNKPYKVFDSEQDFLFTNLSNTQV